MGKTPNEKVADKLISLLADGLTPTADWRLWIPRYITDQPEIVTKNARALSDGIEEHINGNRVEEMIDLSRYESVGEYNGQ